MDDLNRYALDLGFKKTIFFTKKTNKFGVYTKTALQYSFQKTHYLQKISKLIS